MSVPTDPIHAPTGRAWLMKSEPESYSIDDLARDGQTAWEGVRNYQVRNSIRDEMQPGDLVLFYHSNASPPAAVGLARVASAARPDPTQFDPASRYYDAKSPADAPRWLLVDVAFVEKWPRGVSLAELKADPALDGMEVTRKGTRLSVHPLRLDHLARVRALAFGA